MEFGVVLELIPQAQLAQPWMQFVLNLQSLLQEGNFQQAIKLTQSQDFGVYF